MAAVELVVDERGGSGKDDDEGDGDGEGVGFDDGDDGGGSRLVFSFNGSGGGGGGGTACRRLMWPSLRTRREGTRARGRFMMVGPVAEEVRGYFWRRMRAGALPGAAAAVGGAVEGVVPVGVATAVLVGVGREDGGWWCWC